MNLTHISHSPVHVYKTISLQEESFVTSYLLDSLLINKQIQYPHYNKIKTRLNNDDNIIYDNSL